MSYIYLNIELKKCNESNTYTIFYRDKFIYIYIY